MHWNACLLRRTYLFADVPKPHRSFSIFRASLRYEEGSPISLINFLKNIPEGPVSRLSRKIVLPWFHH